MLLILIWTNAGLDFLIKLCDTLLSFEKVSICRGHIEEPVTFIKIWVLRSWKQIDNAYLGEIMIKETTISNCIQVNIILSFLIRRISSKSGNARNPTWFQINPNYWKINHHYSLQSFVWLILIVVGLEIALPFRVFLKVIDLMLVYRYSS